MGNWNYKSSELSKLLTDETIQNGGVQQVNSPIMNCKVSSELESTTVQIGGYPTLVNYNTHREKQHKKNKEEKRIRSLKKQIKRFSCRKNGDDLPSPDVHLGKEGGSKK